MRLLCLSITYHNTPVELRECFSFTPEMIASVYANNPIRAGRFEPLRELAVLSTCNRLEAYALVSSSKNGFEDSDQVSRLMLDYLQEAFHIPGAQIEPYYRAYWENQAAGHLFEVASGLDSIAIGETQILGQVSRALDVALQAGSARHVLSSLFRAAIHTGKRVHSETQVGRHPTGISAIAVRMAADTLGGLADRKVLVVGAGKMGAQAIAALKEHGAEEILLTSRTEEHAAGLARQIGCGCEVLPYERLVEGLARADLVFTSTSAPEPILCRDDLAGIMALRSQQALTVIDLSVPRNVEPGVRGIPGVRLFDMDDLQAYVKKSEATGHPEIAAANAIVTEETAEYEKLLNVVPFIGELHKKIEQIRVQEVERARKALGDVDPQVHEQLELFSQSLVRKILHEPTMHLRSESNQATLNDYVDALTRLFDLDEGGGEGANGRH